MKNRQALNGHAEQQPKFTPFESAYTAATFADQLAEARANAQRLQDEMTRLAQVHKDRSDHARSRREQLAELQRAVDQVTAEAEQYEREAEQARSNRDSVADQHTNTLRFARDLESVLKERAPQSLEDLANRPPRQQRPDNQHIGSSGGYPTAPATT